MKRNARAARELAGRMFVALEEKPLVVIMVAAGATIATSLVLAASAGWPKVLHRVYTPHAWLWLGVCLGGELAAYLGYVLTIRDMARVDDGPELDMAVSAKTVVAGFGVFAATRSSGGFAVDYWAFRRAGAGKRDAASRVLALGFLEYAVLGVAALVASVFLYLRADGHASDSTTLPSLTIIPIFLLAVWATSPKRFRRLSHSGRGEGWIRRTFANSVRGAGTLRTFLTNPHEHGLGVAGSGLYWAGDILCLWAALQLVGGTRITVSALVLAYTGGYVLTRRALPAGGAGIVEVALTFALFWMGVRFVPALVGVLVYRLFNFWLPIVPALALMPAVDRLRARFQNAERTT
ncbi:MAG TPA: lysylphosphatidylglycerol synthase domain-containing protein [Gaiellaceae bacterium]|nr:lysylphosphatidylglycerol synthase domain-containing protein [Gaiellaceae bacterium]